MQINKNININKGKLCVIMSHRIEKKAKKLILPSAKAAQSVSNIFLWMT